MNLPDLCRYYLRCLSVANQDGVVVAQNSSTDYVDLPAHPASDPAGSNLLSHPGVSALVNRTQTGLPKKELLLGYPICRMREPDGTRWRDVLKPVFIAELRFTAGEAGEALFADGNLMLNPGIFASLDALANGDVMAAAVALAEEIGLNLEVPPELEEVCTRIRAARPSWPWLEDITPRVLSQGGELTTLHQNGVYNRAVILAAEPSNFTKGLETELAEMSKFSDAAVSGTALDAWLRRDFSKFQLPRGGGMGLLEPLPLNLEQREAIEKALSQPLTVVTGPPGTGKSQVVSTLLINAAVRGMRVLFSSRNNKAVDVVEQRVNDLGSPPLLLRMGSDDHRQRLQEHIAGLLGSRVTEEHRQTFADAQSDYQVLELRGAEIQRSAERVIELRNQVDHAEQGVEAIREGLGDTLFQSLRKNDAEEIQRTATRISEASERADRSKQGLCVRLLWFLFRKSRLELLNEIARGARGLLDQVGIESPDNREETARVKAWANVGDDLVRRAEETRAIVEYSRLLHQLSQGGRLEECLAALSENKRDKALVSKRVWDGWLRVMPDRLDAQSRDELGNFASVLRTIIQTQADHGAVAAGTWSTFFRLLPRVSSFLPCWAVTALRARKNFPFAPGDFDLLVIDEASQCDIAAVLPLLFRAKAVVIIGDPKQLQFISSLPAAVDAELLQVHGLSSQPIWGFSVNSVYDLAASLAVPENVVELRDHHRSHPDIIGFSDQEFYGRKLRIATDYRKLKFIDPDLAAIQWIDLPGQVTRDHRDGIVNQAEAQKVLKVLERLVLIRNYEGSIGVVTPFRGQKNWLRRIITQKPQLQAALNTRSFLVDTAHGFQGDERDVMIFSPVVSTGITQGALSFLMRSGNVFNVAVTRARAALIIVGDMSAARNSGVSHLARLASYVEDLATRNSADVFPAVTNPEFVSPWEKYFFLTLQESGIALLPQYSVEKYALDFALFDGARRLNIEIDGERYHRDWNGDLLRRDQLRNMRLRELGWDVMRFWVYEVRDEMELCVQRVQGWLEAEKP